MGVVNVTPDSFSDGGRWFSHHDAVAHGHALLDQGADLLDIGGESTPGEATPEMAHRIGLELCKKILKDKYEFVLSTHIDKGHIHNHIIFNNVNMVTGKCYQSNKKSYHKIRYQSDKLCKENNLSVIDEHYESYKKKYKTSGKSWYENEQS